MVDTSSPTLGVATEALLARAFGECALITAQEAAALLGLDVKTLRALTDDLTIRAVRIKKTRRYAEVDLRTYLTESPAAECPSTSPRKAASSNTTSSTKVVAFTALQARKHDAQRKRSSGNSGSTRRRGG